MVVSTGNSQLDFIDALEKGPLQGKAIDPYALYGGQAAQVMPSCGRAAALGPAVEVAAVGTVFTGAGLAGAGSAVHASWVENP